MESEQQAQGAYVVVAVREAMLALVESMPSGARSLADCQSLLGALMLAEAMGVPPEVLSDVVSADGLGAEMAELTADVGLDGLADSLEARIARSLAKLEEQA